MRENLSSGYLTRFNTNWPVQLQKLEISDLKRREIVLNSFAVTAVSHGQKSGFLTMWLIMQ